MDGAIKNARRIPIRWGTYSTTQTSIQIRNAHHRHARFYLDVTGASGTGGLTLAVRGYSWNGIVPTIHGESYGNPGVILTAPAAIAATGVFIYELLPVAQAAHGAVQLAIAETLPVYWDVQVQHADASNYSYAVSVDLIH